MIGSGFIWGELMSDSVIATAILDRLLHHAHVVNIKGESYRLKDRLRAIESGCIKSRRWPFRPGKPPAQKKCQDCEFAVLLGHF